MNSQQIKKITKYDVLNKTYNDSVENEVRNTITVAFYEKMLTNTKRNTPEYVQLSSEIKKHRQFIIENRMTINIVKNTEETFRAQDKEKATLQTKE